MYNWSLLEETLKVLKDSGVRPEDVQYVLTSEVWMTWEEFANIAKRTRYDSGSDDKCPQNWSKYKICSDDNPHECRFLIEASAVKSEESEQESNHSDGRCCKTCKHCREPGAIYICATCYKFSNWEVKK